MRRACPDLPLARTAGRVQPLEKRVSFAPIVQRHTCLVNIRPCRQLLSGGRQGTLYCVGARRHSRLGPPRRSQMFKKSEEQEWTRFRGALSKDRDEVGAMPAAPETVEPVNTNSAGPGSPAVQGASGPSFRPSVGDVNVGLPSARLSRSSVADGVEV